MRFLLLATVLTLVNAAEPSLVLRGVTVVDLAAGKLIPGHTVVVEGRRITRVLPAPAKPTPGQRVIDARGKFVMPGLWDMHVHDSADPGERGRFLSFGVTGVRDMHGPLIRAISPGPRRVVSGPLLNGVPEPPGAIVVRTAGEAHEAVRRLVRNGAEFVKVYNGLPREAYDAIAAECRRAGIPFAGHVPDCVTAAEASAAGQRSIEHLDAVVPATAPVRAVLPRRPLSLRQAIPVFLRNSTWHCPTLGIHRGQFQDVVGEMFRAGVRLLAGSDTGNFGIESGSGLHDEMRLMVAAGIPVRDVLRIATSGAAAYLGREDEFGAVSPGKIADLVLLDANPLADIGNARRVWAVVADGVLYDRAALDRRMR